MVLVTKKATQQFGTQLLKRIFDKEVGESEMLEEQIEEITEDRELNFKDALRLTIESHRENLTQAGKSNVDQISIQKDFRFYDQHQVKSPLLEKLFLALCSAQPTSTQSESNFSLAENFVSKLRTRLTEKHVDNLCF